MNTIVDEIKSRYKKKIDEHKKAIQEIEQEMYRVLSIISHTQYLTEENEATEEESQEQLFPPLKKPTAVDRMRAALKLMPTEFTRHAWYEKTCDDGFGSMPIGTFGWNFTYVFLDKEIEVITVSVAGKPGLYRKIIKPSDASNK